MELQFEWDEDKARINQITHKVSFDEGATIFHDLFIATRPDPIHSEEEQRSISIGFSIKGRLLVVVYTERSDRTRVISCRKATPTERKTYAKHKH